MIKKLMSLFILVIVLGSCASREKLRYYQGVEQAVQQDSTTYNPVLKQDDLLLIVVSAPNSAAAKDFNLLNISVVGDVVSAGASPDIATAQQRFYSYLIDNQGMIQFPVLGALKLGGLSRRAALELLNSRLKPYINEPTVLLRILNYKISVQGEVARPGTYDIASERITLPEALARAGDLTIYGKRDNILIIRDVNGKKSSHFVDITKADFINSPFYYLSQNDVVYVEPNKTRMNGSGVGPNISLILTSVSLLITIIALLRR
jgi:polysaccharide export outer membrane protein